MNLLSCLGLVWKNRRFVAGALVLSVVTALVLTAVTVPTYAASVSMLVSASNQEGGTITAYQAALLSQQRMQSYANLLTSRRVVRAVAGEGDVEELRKRIEAEAVPDTVLLRATVTDDDPRRAAYLADSLSRAFARLIDDLECPAQCPDGAKVSVSVVDRAEVPVTPISPRPLVNVGLGALIGLVVTVGAIIVGDRLNTTIRTPEGLREAAGVPVLGEIGHERAARPYPLIAGRGEPLPQAEALHTLRANLQFMETGHRPRSLVVTGCLPGEGASSVCAALAAVLAEAGWRVTLVDGDLRRPSLGAYLGVGDRPGLTDVLAGRVETAAATRRWDGPSGRLAVLPSGPLPASPSVLLGSGRMRLLIDELAGACDLVIVDTPPLLSVVDAAALAANCDGALLVARHGVPRQQDLARAVGLLSSVGARLLGTVLNFAPAHRADARDYTARAPVDPALDVVSPPAGA
ncbi:polysaccharide biosynthesis tyrosine autokinase [Streptosporangium sp. NPDC051022]|uniref:polysaccharide biosynthesis tyrosine autokinase n=1 Tax=Streptosporangium sp. NPDC051022 TaxID=3155752 RepID=UPI0034133172